MKDVLGFPTAFFSKSREKVVDMRRSVSHPLGLAYDKSFDLNHKALSEAISLLLIHDTSEVSDIFHRNCFTLICFLL